MKIGGLTPFAVSLFRLNAYLPSVIKLNRPQREKHRFCMSLGRCNRGSLAVKERKADTCFPLLHLSGYGKGCPSPTVDLLLVLDPKHNDATIGGS